ncbi:MAG: DUF2330 domain-containing protein [Planctomycetes bacterium]|nr:DUF2330 domain-containing protein [Planctomycetota bacterium]
MSRTPALILAAAAVAAPVFACEHLPRGYDGTLEQTAQEAIVFWNAGREILVLKNDFRIDPGASGQLPSHLAWVLPVPSEPSAYAVEDVEVFRDLFAAWEEQFAENSKEELEEDGPPAGEEMELLKKVEVGEYEIQPIRARGEEGAKALGAWLSTNGFGEVPAENLAWYAGRGWVWLAVKVRLAQGESELVRNGSLRPLSISFATDEIAYPVLVNAGQGTFDVNLYIVTEDEVADIGEQVARYGFSFEGVLSFALPERVQAIQERAAREGSWKTIESPCVHKVVGRGVNGPRISLASWKDDFKITPR